MHQHIRFSKRPRSKRGSNLLQKKLWNNWQYCGRSHSKSQVNRWLMAADGFQNVTDELHHNHLQTYGTLSVCNNVSTIKHKSHFWTVAASYRVHSQSVARHKQQNVRVSGFRAAFTLRATIAKSRCQHDSADKLRSVLANSFSRSFFHVFWIVIRTNVENFAHTKS